MLKIAFDTLWCAKMLCKRGIDKDDAEAITETLSSIEINNIYTTNEVNEMLADSVKNVLDEFRRESAQGRDDVNRSFAERKSEMDKRFEIQEKRIEQDLAEARSGRRWMVGTIITCTFALAGYLSALIHFTH